MYTNSLEIMRLIACGRDVEPPSCRLLSFYLISSLLSG